MCGYNHGVRFLCFIFTLMCGALPQRAAAQVSHQAQQAYEQGRAHYQAGRYEEAAEALERAHAADPDAPVLIYNLARVYELLAQHERSLGHYRRYLGMLEGTGPEVAEERARTEQAIARVEGAAERARIAEAQEQAAEEARLAEVEAEATRRALRASPRGRADAVFYATLIAGGGLLVTGMVTGIMALRLDNESDDWVLPTDASWTEYRSQQDRARRLAIISDVTLVAGGAAGLTALLLYYIRRSGDGSTGVLSVALAPHTGGAMVSIGGRL